MLCRGDSRIARNLPTYRFYGGQFVNYPYKANYQFYKEKNDEKIFQKT